MSVSVLVNDADVFAADRRDRDSMSSNPGTAPSEDEANVAVTSALNDLGEPAIYLQLLLRDSRLHAAE